MSATTTWDEVTKAANYVRSNTKYHPTLGIILGSGLGKFAELLEDPDIIAYKDIPNFPISTVPGHKGNFVIGRLYGKTIICMQGRFHLYEGYTSEKCALPVRVLHLLGVKTFIMSNACGALNTTYNCGDIMLMKDHICMPALNGSGPLVGVGNTKNGFGSKFVNMINTYDKSLRDLVKQVANTIGMKLQEGVYLMQSGPQYETPAECRLMLICGADVAGMSTAHEAIIARQCNAKVIGLSLVTNICEMDSDSTGEEGNSELHEDVLKCGENSSKKFTQLVAEIVRSL